MPTDVTSIDSKVCDMMVDLFYIEFRNVHAITSKPYITNWATVIKIWPELPN